MGVLPEFRKTPQGLEAEEGLPEAEDALKDTTQRVRPPGEDPPAKRQRAPGQVPVWIKHRTGSPGLVHVQPTEALGRILQEVAVKEGLAQDELGVTYLGKVVQPTHSLADLGASKWSTLTVTLGVLGGARDSGDEDEAMADAAGQGATPGGAAAVPTPFDNEFDSLLEDVVLVPEKRLKTAGLLSNMMKAFVRETAQEVTKEHTRIT